MCKQYLKKLWNIKANCYCDPLRQRDEWNWNSCSVCTNETFRFVFAPVWNKNNVSTIPGDWVMKSCEWWFRGSFLTMENIVRSMRKLSFKNVFILRSYDYVRFFKGHSRIFFKIKMTWLIILKKTWIYDCLISQKFFNHIWLTYISNLDFEFNCNLINSLDFCCITWLC